MAEIKEVMEDAKDFLGDNGFMLLIGGVVVIFVVNLVRQQNAETTTMVTATGYSAYPEAGANANVIIDSLQNSIQYSQDEISDNFNSKLDDMTSNITDEFGALGDHIESNNEDLKDYLDSNFSATNDYISSGFESQKNLINQNTQAIIGDIDSSRNTILSNHSIMNSNIKNLQNQLNGMRNQMNSGVSSTVTPPTSSYFARTPYTGVSIVDGLKAIGADSSYNARAQYAAKNGIANYTGTAAQNTQMLNMLKSGTLKK